MKFPVIAGLVRRAASRLELERDRARWRLDLGGTWSRRPDPAFAPSDAQVLFLELGASPWQAKLEGLLGRAARQWGATPGYLAGPTDRRIVAPYLDALGIPYFVPLERYAERVPMGDVAERARALLADAHEFAQIAELTHEGVDIGQASLSIVLRSYRSTGVGLDTPGFREKLTKTMKESIYAAETAKRLFEEVRPRVVVVHDKMHVRTAIAEVAMLRGIDVVHYANAQSKDSFAVKRLRPETRHSHPLSIGRSSWDRITREPRSPTIVSGVRRMIEESYAKGLWFDRKFVSVDRHLVPPDPLRESLELPRGRRVVGVFPHISWDATFAYGRTHFGGYESWFRETLRAAAKNSSVEWLIKVHPDHVWKGKLEDARGPDSETSLIGSVLPQLPSHVHLVPPETKVHTVSYFGVVDVGVTVRGTVGIEMACFGIPVITGGTGRYSGLGFTHDSPDPPSYLEALATIQDLPAPLAPEKVELACLFADAVFRRRPWRPAGIRSTQRGLQAVRRVNAHDLRPVAPDPAAFARSPGMEDLVRFLLDGLEDDLFPGQNVAAPEPGADLPRPISIVGGPP